MPIINAWTGATLKTLLGFFMSLTHCVLSTYSSPVFVMTLNATRHYLLVLKKKQMLMIFQLLMSAIIAIFFKIIEQ